MAIAEESGEYEKFDESRDKDLHQPTWMVIHRLLLTVMRNACQVAVEAALVYSCCKKLEHLTSYAVARILGGIVVSVPLHGALQTADSLFSHAAAVAID